MTTHSFLRLTPSCFIFLEPPNCLLSITAVGNPALLKAFGVHRYLCKLYLAENRLIWRSVSAVASSPNLREDPWRALVATEILIGLRSCASAKHPSMPHVTTANCLQTMAAFSSDVSMLSDEFSESNNLELVRMTKSSGKLAHGRMSSARRKKQLLAASAREKRQLRTTGEDAPAPAAGAAVSVTATSQPVGVAEAVCADGSTTSAGTSDATTAALPHRTSGSAAKLALMRGDSRPASVADGKLDVFFYCSDILVIM